MIQKILYADAGTGNSQEMLKFLQDIPTFKNAQLTILHVVPTQITTDAREAKWEEGGKVIGSVINNLKLDPNRVSTVLREGEPKDAVCQVAAEIDADLIIMGSRGLKRLESILENSVSQYVFQLTNRPMLLVKDDIYVRKIKRVMVALDKSAVAQYALDLTIGFLRDYSEAELILTRVNPDLDPNITLSKAEMENNPIVGPAIAKAKTMGIKYKAIVTGGRPSQQICKLAEENNIDLLVMGSPDRRPSVAKSLPDLDRLLGTSLSDYIRVNAPCPVLLARRDG
jgi:nucleotide-binding universal stress UspA family protein